MYFKHKADISNTFSVSKRKEAHLPPDFVRYCHAAQLNEDTD